MLYSYFPLTSSSKVPPSILKLCILHNKLYHESIFFICQMKVMMISYGYFEDLISKMLRALC